MISRKLNNAGVGTTGETHLSVYQHKQSPIAMKKTALRDVQNDNRSVVHNHPENFCSLGAKNLNGSKLSGIKRSNPMSSPSSAIHQSFKRIGVNEHIMAGSGEFDTKPNKKRVLGCNISCAPAFSSIPVASSITYSPVSLSLPVFIEEPGHDVMAVAGSNLLGIPPRLEVPHSVASNGIIDEKRDERLFNLQKLLKHCDEYDLKGYIEWKEIQRMKALNILGYLQ